MVRVSFNSNADIILICRKNDISKFAKGNLGNLEVTEGTNCLHTYKVMQGRIERGHSFKYISSQYNKK